jgi:hypothetical protein
MSLPHQSTPINARLPLLLLPARGDARAGSKIQYMLDSVPQVYLTDYVFFSTTALYSCFHVSLTITASQL